MGGYLAVACNETGCAKTERTVKHTYGSGEWVCPALGDRRPCAFVVRRAAASPRAGARRASAREAQGSGFNVDLLLRHSVLTLKLNNC